MTEQAAQALGPSLTSRGHHWRGKVEDGKASSVDLVCIRCQAETHIGAFHRMWKCEAV